MAKKKNDAGRGLAGRGTQILLVGIVLFAVSWFVPVFKGQDLFGGLSIWSQQLGASPNAARAALDTNDWLPGWGACRFAWHMLTDSDLSAGDPWRQRLAGSSCLTNIAMLLAIALAVARRNQIVIGLVLLGCVAVNASWIYLIDQNPFEVYRAGYFLWLASFAVVGVGALLRGGQPA